MLMMPFWKSLFFPNQNWYWNSALTTSNILRSFKMLVSVTYFDQTLCILIIKALINIKKSYRFQSSSRCRVSRWRANDFAVDSSTTLQSEKTYIAQLGRHTGYFFRNSSKKVDQLLLRISAWSTIAEWRTIYIYRHWLLWQYTENVILNKIDEI